MASRDDKGSSVTIEHCSVNDLMLDAVVCNAPKKKNGGVLRRTMSLDPGVSIVYMDSERYVYDFKFEDGILTIHNNDFEDRIEITFDHMVHRICCVIQCHNWNVLQEVFKQIDSAILRGCDRNEYGRIRRRILYSCSTFSHSDGVYTNPFLFELGAPRRLNFV